MLRSVLKKKLIKLYTLISEDQCIINNERKTRDMIMLEKNKQKGYLIN